ncbi:MAG: trigger factor [Geminicoccaceae bacterium]|nr:trigger factor [Geminicoccaceae bacterium]
MQVTEVAAEGLKREYKVTVAASEIEDRVQSRLKKLAKTAKIPGFRPGKVPVSLLRKQYGRSVMGEVLEQAVDEGSRRAISDNALKPALRPKVEVTSFNDGADLEFRMDVEILPEVPSVDPASLILTRQVTEVSEDQLAKSLDNLARVRRQYKAVETPRPSAKDDQIVIDFVGTVDGVEFDGGKAEDFELDLGAGRMIPGFEDQLVGKNAGEDVTVDVTFPEEYGAEHLAGKPASFAVKVKEIREAAPVVIDDELAKQFGADTLDELKTRLKERIGSEFAQASRSKLKRQLLDRLAEQFDFEVPQGMVDLEFEAIWTQLEEEMKRTGQNFGDGEQSEEETRKEYRSIAERRVRLGLILSDVGTKNDVKVEPQELQRALVEQARAYPGKEREVFDYFRNNAAALEQLRAPIFEDKVVDYMIERASVTDENVSAEELMRDPDDEETPADRKDGEDKE